ncbi:MAG: hypothetical protein V8Q81_05815 [Christensenellales bacterium]
MRSWLESAARPTMGSPALAPISVCPPETLTEPDSSPQDSMVRLPPGSLDQ